MAFCILWVLVLTGELNVAEDEREFAYNLDSKKGPNSWGDLREDWALCSKGRMQSPIDLSDPNVTIIPDFGDLKRSYHLSNASIKNRGHDIAVRKGDSLSTLFCLYSTHHNQKVPTQHPARLI